jgi:ubiquinone/menaquinone biosynthesis C-methylase UbiE
MIKTFLNIILLYYIFFQTSLVWTQSYSFQTPTRDGIGKKYQGREISKVMGHLGASWLERRTRVDEENPNLAIDLLQLRKDMLVADLGAGTGYFTSKMAPKCSVVYAVDIQQEMLDLNAKQMSKKGIKNVEFILGSNNQTGLPKNTLDLVLLVDVYHELENPYEIMNDIKLALNDSGKVVLLEYRKEDPSVPIKPLHKMSIDQMIKEMNFIGLKLHMNIQKLPIQHMLIFSKL